MGVNITNVFNDLCCVFLRCLATAVSSEGAVSNNVLYYRSQERFDANKNV